MYCADNDCIMIDCGYLAKNRINEKIATQTENLKDVILSVRRYKYDTFENIIIPDNVIAFSCYYQKIKSYSASFGLPD
jgi:hypothetical protein